MKKLKIGQIGIGHNHGSAKMEAFRKFPDRFEIVGFSEEDPVWLRERSELPAYQGLTRMGTEELLDKCDAILVETMVPNLTNTARLCVEAGKHIHLDKPGSGTLELSKSLHWLFDNGYNGFVGLEYRPTADTQSSLEMTFRTLGPR